MNERIQKLYDQADKFAKENRTQTISGPGNNYFELFHEKFAELIIRECAVYCEGHILPKGVAEENGLNYNDGVRDCAIGLKQHFGVE